MIRNPNRRLAQLRGFSFATMGSRLFALAVALAGLALYHSSPTGARGFVAVSAAVTMSTSPFEPRRLSLADFADVEPE